MTTRLKAKLEKSIQRWIDEECEHGDWPQFWVCDSFVPLMTEAAYSVFKASYEGQQFAEKEGIR